MRAPKAARSWGWRATDQQVVPPPARRRLSRRAYRDSPARYSAVVRRFQQVRRHLVEQRLLGQEVTGSGRARTRRRPCRPRPRRRVHCRSQRFPQRNAGHHPRDAEQGVAAQADRVQERVIDAPVDDVDRLVPARRLEIGPSGRAPSDRALRPVGPPSCCARTHARNRPELRQPRRQHHDARVISPIGCCGRQCLAQHQRPLVDLGDVVSGETPQGIRGA